MPLWQGWLEAVIRRDRRPSDVPCMRKEKGLFQTFLIESYGRETEPMRRWIVRSLYRYLGFAEEDIERLHARFLRKKIKALERLEAMQFNTIEKEVMPLLSHRRHKVRYAAFKALTAFHAPALLRRLPSLFEENPRWAFRYIVNLLRQAHLSHDTLQGFADSPNPDMRRAAAMLLERESVPADAHRMDDRDVHAVVSIEPHRAVGGAEPREPLPQYPNSIAPFPPGAPQAA